MVLCGHGAVQHSIIFLIFSAPDFLDGFGHVDILVQNKNIH